MNWVEILKRVHSQDSATAEQLGVSEGELKALASKGYLVTNSYGKKTTFALSDKGAHVVSDSN